VNKYKTKVPDGNGSLMVVEPENELMEYVHMEYLRLLDGQSHTVGWEDREIGILLMGGKFKVKYENKEEIIDGRHDSFSGLPHAVYIPAGKSVEITAMSFFEASIYGTPAEKKGKIEIIRPDDIKILEIGSGNWYINGYFVIGSDFPAQKLIIGETQIPAGNWCSVPPHSHEKDVPGVETKLEEIYLFKFKPEQGFGFQGLYTDNRKLDRAYILRNNDVILIPEGYHPNVAGPGYEMRMFWGMGGKSRYWIPYEDPDHKWVGENATAPSDVSWDKDNKK